MLTLDRNSEAQNHNGNFPHEKGVKHMCYSKQLYMLTLQWLQYVATCILPDENFVPGGMKNAI